LYNFTKGREISDELADTYGDILSNTATTVLPTVNVRVNAKKTGEGDKTYSGWIKNPRIIVDNNREITIDPRLKDRVFEDMNTGDYVITSPTHKEILFRTMNPTDLEDIDKARDLMYAYHTRQDALDYTAHRQALDELFGNNVVNSHINNGWNPETGKKVQDLARDVRVGRNRFARGVNAVVNGFNHAIAGLPRMALNDNYTLEDYKQGFLDSPHKSTVGVGDVLEVQNPNVRWAANLVNPMSVGYTTANAYANYEPSRFTPVTFRVAGLKYNPGEMNVNPRTWMPIMFNDDAEVIPEWNPDPQGTTEVSGPRDYYIDWAATGNTPQIQWVAPTKENTSGGNFIWYDTDDKKIVSTPGVGRHSKTKTKGVPAARSHAGT